jgi:hypothetical protein
VVNRQDRLAAIRRARQLIPSRRSTLDVRLSRSSAATALNSGSQSLRVPDYPEQGCQTAPLATAAEEMRPTRGDRWCGVAKPHPPPITPSSGRQAAYRGVPAETTRHAAKPSIGCRKLPQSELHLSGSARGRWATTQDRHFATVPTHRAGWRAPAATSTALLALWNSQRLLCRRCSSAARRRGSAARSFATFSSSLTAICASSWRTLTGVSPTTRRRERGDKSS